MNNIIEVIGQWSDQEPLSPRLATGKSPADYWSICIVINILLFLFLLCTYLGVCNNNINNIININNSLTKRKSFSFAAEKPIYVEHDQY